MAQQLDLTTPDAHPSTLSWNLRHLRVDFTDNVVTLELVSDIGQTLSRAYTSATSPTGASLITALNTANFSAGTSLVNAIYDFLVNTGVLVGTVSGTPQ